MITIEALTALGANTQEGLERCLGNNEFYLRFVGMAIHDDHYQGLKDAIAQKDLDKAFDMAHALKGVLANVSLTNILRPVQDITEHLRAREDMDYGPLLDEMFAELDKVLALED